MGMIFKGHSFIKLCTVILTNDPVLYTRKHPLRYVLLACPSLKHLSPTSEDCWLPRI
jgi:hypothetical protein